ncbi:MAG: response regulator [Alphaproteobacteria bacterium]
MSTPAQDEAPHILVVDDDDRLRDLISRFLAKEGFRTTMACDAAQARGRMNGMVFDAIVLDVMMPGETGFEFLKSLRITDDTPVLMLTAMGEVTDRITGLEHGADDYLPKPFEPMELALRLRAIMKRSAQTTAPETSERQRLHFGPLTYDVGQEKLSRSDGSTIKLTEAETRLLKILSARQGAPIAREDLAHLTGAGQDRAIDVQVTRLRRKIERNPRDPQFLKTVRGIGYRLVPDATPDT